MFCIGQSDIKLDVSFTSKVTKQLDVKSFGGSYGWAMRFTSLSLIEFTDSKTFSCQISFSSCFVEYSEVPNLKKIPLL